MFLKFCSETDGARTGDVVCLLPALHQRQTERDRSVTTNIKPRSAHSKKGRTHELDWCQHGSSWRQRPCHPVSLSPVKADSSTSDVPAIPSQGHPPREILQQPHVQPTLRPAFERAEPSERERVTEKQWRLKCLALSCSSHFSTRTDDISVAARLKTKN